MNNKLIKGQIINVKMRDDLAMQSAQEFTEKTTGCGITYSK